MAEFLKYTGETKDVFPMDSSVGFTAEEVLRLLQCETVQVLIRPDGAESLLVVDAKAQLQDIRLFRVNRLATELLHRMGGDPLDEVVVGHCLFAAPGEVLWR